mgnify:CR=1 FL=1
MKFKFHGISAHAAQSPESGRSALDAVELMNVGANYLREHVIDAARIHYTITNAEGHQLIKNRRYNLRMTLGSSLLKSTSSSAAGATTATCGKASATSKGAGCTSSAAIER